MLMGVARCRMSRCPRSAWLYFGTLSCHTADHDSLKQCGGSGATLSATRPPNCFVKTKVTVDGNLKNLYRAGIDVALTA